MKRSIVPLLFFLVFAVRPCFAQLPQLGRFTGTYTHIATGQEGEAVLEIQYAPRSEEASIAQGPSLPRPTASLTGQAHFMPLPKDGYCIAGNLIPELSGLTVHDAGHSSLGFFIDASEGSGCFTEDVLVNAVLSADGNSISGRYFDGQPHLAKLTGEIHLTRECASEDPCVQVREDPKLGCVTDDGHSFNPDFWNDSDTNDAGTQDYNNCYAYAINKATGTYPQPGRGAGLGEIDASDVTCPGITSRAVADGLRSHDCDITCPDGGRKVALVISPFLDDEDYHWYRQEADGMWSHKRASLPAETSDASGNPITDPRTSNRDFTSRSSPNYTEFCGCFCIHPDDCNRLKVK